MGSRKVFSLLVVFAVFCSTTVWAMDARKQVLGTGTGIVGENASAGLVLDSADMFSNPAYLLTYPNMLGMDGVAPDFSTGFATADLSKIGVPGVLGVQVGRAYGMLKTDTLNPAATDSFNTLNTAIAAVLPGPTGVNTTIGGAAAIGLLDLTGVSSYGLMYGLGLQKNLQAGIALNFIGNNIKGKTNPLVPASSDVSKSMGDMEVRLGTVMEMTSSLNGSLDLGLNFPSFNFTQTGGVVPVNQKVDFSGFNMDLNLRLAYALNKGMDAVFLAQYASFGGDTQIDPDTTVSGNETTLTLGSSDLMLGVGALAHDPNGLEGAIIGFMSQGFSNDAKVALGSTKNDPSLIFFPTLKVLAERNLASWFTVRASIAYAMVGSSTSVTNGGGISYTLNQPASSTILTAFGTTLNFNPFFLESVISKNLLFNGPYIVGGVNNTGLNTVLSAGYKF